MHLLLTAEPTRAADVHGLALTSQTEALNQFVPGEMWVVAVPALWVNSEQRCVRGLVERAAMRV